MHAIIPAFRKLRLEYCSKFKASLGYTVNSRPAWDKEPLFQNNKTTRDILLSFFIIILFTIVVIKSTKTSNNRSIDKENVAYINNGVLSATMKI